MHHCELPHHCVPRKHQVMGTANTIDIACVSPKVVAALKMHPGGLPSCPLSKQLAHGQILQVVKSVDSESDDVLNLRGPPVAWKGRGVKSRETCRRRIGVLLLLHPAKLSTRYETWRKSLKRGKCGERKRISERTEGRTDEKEDVIVLLSCCCVVVLALAS